MSFENQKSIQINKKPCDALNFYAKINLEAMQNAMSRLTKMGSIKLWLYLAKNQNNYKFDLSCAECKKWGLKADAYHAAVKDLVDKGFLFKDHGNLYIFNEMPQNTEKP